MNEFEVICTFYVHCIYAFIVQSDNKKKCKQIIASMYRNMHITHRKAKTYKNISTLIRDQVLIIALRYAQLIAKYDKHVAEIVVSLKANNDLKTISICAAEPTHLPSHFQRFLFTKCGTVTEQRFTVSRW